MKVKLFFYIFSNFDLPEINETLTENPLDLNDTITENCSISSGVENETDFDVTTSRPTITRFLSYKMSVDLLVNLCPIDD